MNDLIRRRDAAQATMDRFRDRPLRYGRDDCVRMAAFHLRQLKIRAPLLKAGSYSSERGAMKALKRTGFATLPDAVDAVLGPESRLAAPAMALAGDLLALPAERFGGALMIAVGNGRAFGYFEGRFQVGQPHLFEAAWRPV